MLCCAENQLLRVLCCADGQLLRVLCRIRVSFSDNYPLEPPEVLFLEPSPVHPHIYRCLLPVPFFDYIAYYEGTVP